MEILCSVSLRYLNGEVFCFLVTLQIRQRRLMFSAPDELLCLKCVCADAALSAADPVIVDLTVHNDCHTAV